MRHVGQESRFQPVGTFCFVAGCYQALLDAFMFRNVAVYAVAAYNLVVYCYRCGKDGNIDLQTSKVIPSTRVREVLVSSFAVQAPGRK